ncbi:hypothetical protein PHLCEN_2v8945 [Hermanssonia centrifuga]|uniref:Uncharacterized protein n=1 Tax=Hermanssonia centrifuga TaxID=98765 RepID=A0A2R6NS27_9APHY|nr:hypothetical protein PHLCEN_2v8945 [Hermanssonia centrifuga]
MSEQLLQFSFDSTLGAVFIGYTFALVLHDHRGNRVILSGYTLLKRLLDNLHTILISHGTYLLLVSYHANPFEAIAAPPW